MAGLAAGLFYYKAEAASNAAKVSEERAAKDAALAANTSLRTQLLNNTHSMNDFVGSLATLAEQNANMNQSLQAVQTKNATRNWQGLRESRHAERVLAIINASGDKKHAEWVQ